MQIARAMPAAVKEAQEDAANARRDANLAPLLSLLDACRSCYDLGAVRGFSYNPTEHRVVCEDCFRWGGLGLAPSNLTRADSGFAPLLSRAVDERQGCGGGGGCADPGEVLSGNVPMSYPHQLDQSL